MGSFGDVQDGLAGPVGAIVEGQRLEIRVNGLHRRTNRVEKRRGDSIAVADGQLDHCGGVSTTTADDLEALGTQHRFAGLDRTEAGLGDTGTGVEPTRQAWRGRQIGLDDAEVSGNGANAGLADTGFDERVSHPGLGGGLYGGAFSSDSGTGAFSAFAAPADGGFREGAVCGTAKGASAEAAIRRRGEGAEVTAEGATIQAAAEDGRRRAGTAATEAVRSAAAEGAAAVRRRPHQIV